MAFPPDIFAPRDKENKNGVAYDPLKKSTLFVEDIQAIENEIIAIEEYLMSL